MCVCVRVFTCTSILVWISNGSYFSNNGFPSPSLISLASKMRIYKTLWRLLNIRCMSGSRKKKNDYDYTEFIYCRIKMAPIAVVSLKD